MNWDAIGSVGELIGAIAVVITLVFLTVQLKQNTRSIRASTRSQHTEAVSNSLATLQNQNFASVMITGMNDPESLSAVDKLRFGSYLLRLLRGWEDAYFHWRDGDYDEGAWHSNRAFMLDMLSISGVNAYFNTRKGWLDGRFVAYIEEELSHYETEITLEYIEEVSDDTQQ
jgi:hypothetical protein